MHESKHKTMSTKSLGIKKTAIYVKQRGLHFPTLKPIGFLIRNEQVAPSLSHLRRPDRWLKGYVSHYWTRYQDRRPRTTRRISPNWDPLVAGSSPHFVRWSLDQKDGNGQRMVPWFSNKLTLDALDGGRQDSLHPRGSRRSIWFRWFLCKDG